MNLESSIHNFSNTENLMILILCSGFLKLVRSLLVIYLQHQKENVFDEFIHP